VVRDVITQKDARTLGATGVATWGSAGLVLVSPTTEKAVFLDTSVGLARAPSLTLSGKAPRSVAIDAETNRGWIGGEKTLTEVGGTLRSPLNLGTLQLTERHTGWLALGRSLPQLVNRIDSRARHLVKEGTTDHHVAYAQSDKLLVVPTTNTLTAVDASRPGMIVVDSIIAPTPKLEAGVFDPLTGCVYIMDSGGQGAVVELRSNNRLAIIASVQFPNMRGPIQLRMFDTTLYVLCESRKRVITWNMTDPTDPVLLTDVVYASADLYWEKNPLCAVLADRTVVSRNGPLAWIPLDLPVTAAEFDTDADRAWAVHADVAAVAFSPTFPLAQPGDVVAIIGDTSGANQMCRKRKGGAWEQFSLGAQGIACSVWTGVRWVAFGYNRVVYTSPDGVNWTAGPTLAGAGVPYDCAASENGKIVAVTFGTDKTLHLSVTGGVTWDGAVHTPILGANSFPGTLAITGERIVVGTANLLSAPHPPMTAWADITALPAPGSPWTPSVGPFPVGIYSAYLIGLVRRNGVLTAVPAGTSGTTIDVPSRVAESLDGGATWTPILSPSVAESYPGGSSVYTSFGYSAVAGLWLSTRAFTTTKASADRATWATWVEPTPTWSGGRFICDIDGVPSLVTSGGTVYQLNGTLWVKAPGQVPGGNILRGIGVRE
jgi:hypothetical protein